MQEKRKVNFQELRPIVDVGHAFRLRRFFKSLFGGIGLFGAGSGVAAVAQTVAVAAGVTAGVATAAVMPAIIVPVAGLSFGVLLWNQYKTRQMQKGRWEEIFGAPNALGTFRKNLRYFVENGIWVHGLKEMLDNFEGDSIEEKLHNIFEEEYEGLEKKDFVRCYKSAQEKESEREALLSQFFDENKEPLNIKKKAAQELIAELKSQVSKLTPDQYDRLSPKISAFHANNPEVNLYPGVRIQNTTYSSERTVKKGWKYYLEHGGKTVLAALMGAATGFGLVVGIAALAGTSATGIGLPVLIAAIVVAVVVAVIAVAVKKYVDDREDDIGEALKDGAVACNTFSNELTHAKERILDKEENEVYKISAVNEDEFSVLKKSIQSQMKPIKAADNTRNTYEPLYKNEEKKFTFKRLMPRFPWNRNKEELVKADPPVLKKK